MMLFNDPLNDEDKHLHHVSKFISSESFDVFKAIFENFEARKPRDSS
jgi:hypothetical protein